MDVVINDDGAEQIAEPAKTDTDKAIETAETIIEAASELSNQQRIVADSAALDAIRMIGDLVTAALGDFGVKIEILSAQMSDIQSQLSAIDYKVEKVDDEITEGVEEIKEIEEEEIIAETGETSEETAEENPPEKRARKTRRWL